MTQTHPVDPEIAPVLDVFPAFELSDEALDSVRQMLGRPRPDGPAPLIEPEERFAPSYGDAPPVRLLLFDPPGRTHRAAILHMHGGGTVMGCADVSAVNNAVLARDLGVLIVSVDYRLSPEAPFPAALDDSVAAYDWMQAAADELRIDPGRIAVAGESAGGLLAAALALMARDTKRTPPCFQLLTYPMLDHRTGSEAHPGIVGTGNHIWTRHSNRYAWSALGQEHVPEGERAAWFSPSLAHDLTGLPPAWIGVGALDLFLAEDLDYAGRLGAAGTAVELQIYRGAFHAFDMVEAAAVTRRYRADIRRALTSALGLAG